MCFCTTSLLTQFYVAGALARIVELRHSSVTIRLCDSGANSDAIWHLPRLCFEFKLPRIARPIIRHQLPLRLAWASTVHRIQGDDLDRVLIDTRHPYFAHGQLLVAMTRGHTRDATHFFVPEEDMSDDSFKVVNVVIPAMLSNQ